MQIKTLYDIHNFANGLLYKLPAGELPTNVSVRLDLSQEDYFKLHNEINDLVGMVLPEPPKSGLGWYSYQYTNVKFYIYLKQGE